MVDPYKESQKQIQKAQREKAGLDQYREKLPEREKIDPKKKGKK